MYNESDPNSKVYLSKIGYSTYNGDPYYYISNIDITSSWTGIAPFRKALVLYIPNTYNVETVDE